MSKKNLSRRDFLKLTGISAAGFSLDTFRRYSELPFYPPFSIARLRVAVKEITVYEEPDFESDEAATCYRDELLYAYEEVTSPYGPTHNPRWYRIESGYIHSAYLQRVESHRNPVTYHIPESGQLAEVSVPISLSFRDDPLHGWVPLYRLYYQSMHWVTKIGYGPNGQAWYGIKDDLLGIIYHVPAPHMRLVQPEELAPLSPEVPQEEKRLLVNRTRQTVTAFEREEIVFQTAVSTGMPYRSPNNSGVSTITPVGNFYIDIKMPVRHMGDGQITGDIEAYELPGVPWVCYFYKTGVAFHGCYWHDNYGTEMSHGCVNMKPEEAKWLYRWATPESTHADRVKGGRGTTVEVVT